jgi:hypothetical protein
MARRKKQIERLTEHFIDTIVIPMGESGFNEVFLKKKMWYSTYKQDGNSDNATSIPKAITIAPEKRNKLKWAAPYRSGPGGIITHSAPIEELVPLDNGWIIKLLDYPAELDHPIRKLPGSSAKAQRSMYTIYERFSWAHNTEEIFSKTLFPREIAKFFPGEDAIEETTITVSGASNIDISGSSQVVLDELENSRSLRKAIISAVRMLDPILKNEGNRLIVRFHWRTNVPRAVADISYRGLCTNNTSEIDVERLLEIFEILVAGHIGTTGYRKQDVEVKTTPEGMLIVWGSVPSLELDNGTYVDVKEGVPNLRLCVDHNGYERDTIGKFIRRDGSSLFVINDENKIVIGDVFQPIPAQIFGIVDDSSESIECRGVQRAHPSNYWERLVDDLLNKYGIFTDKFGASRTTEGRSSARYRLGHDEWARDLARVTGDRCAVTGLTNGFSDLIASHIYSWCKSTSKARLDVENGIMLNRQLDGWFDKFWCSFEDDGSPLTSFMFDAVQKEKRKLHGLGMPLRSDLLTIRRVWYLRLHRNRFYEKEAERRLLYCV